LIAEAEESQSEGELDEGEPSNIVLFNFVDIKESRYKICKKNYTTITPLNLVCRG